MNNLDYITYIESHIKELFKGITIINRKFENLPNDAFLIVFEKNGVKVSFYYDKGFINGEITRGNDFIPFWKIDSTLSNLWLDNFKKIDIIIQFLFENKKNVLPEW